MLGSMGLQFRSLHEETITVLASLNNNKPHKTCLLDSVGKSELWQKDKVKLILIYHNFVQLLNPDNKTIQQLIVKKGFVSKQK